MFKQIAVPVLGVSRTSLRFGAGKKVGQAVKRMAPSGARELHGPSGPNSPAAALLAATSSRPPSKSDSLPPRANNLQTRSLVSVVPAGLKAEQGLSHQMLRLVAYLVANRLMNERLDDKAVADLLSLTNSVATVRGEEKINHRGNVPGEHQDAAIDHLVARELAEKLSPGQYQNAFMAATASLLHTGACDDVAALLQVVHAPRLGHYQALQLVGVQATPTSPEHVTAVLKPDSLKDDPSNDRIADPLAGGVGYPEPACLARHAVHGTVKRDDRGSVTRADAEDLKERFDWAVGLAKTESAEKLENRRNQFKDLGTCEIKDGWESAPIYKPSFCRDARKAVALSLEADHEAVCQCAREELARVSDLHPDDALLSAIIDEAQHLDRLRNAAPDAR